MNNVFVIITNAKLGVIIETDDKNRTYFIVGTKKDKRKSVPIRLFLVNLHHYTKLNHLKLSSL